MSTTLMHYGVKGMRWGIRKSDTKSGRTTQTTKKKPVQVDTPPKKKISEMTDAELREKIERLGLEKRYKEAMATTLPPPKTKSRAQKLVEDILYNSANNIGTQAVTYIMGRGANTLLKKIFDEANAVNPKKGQKDK